MILTPNQIYQGEIFQQSQCIWHENQLINFLRSLLVQSNYVSQGSSNKRYKKENKTIVVCFSDDIESEGLYQSSEFDLFDSDTTVITDNFVCCPTTYRVHRLPDSYFGIYYYRPQNQSWQPDRRFNININRIDTNRILILLEYTKKFGINPWQNLSDYVNFNCFSSDGDKNDPNIANVNFEKFFKSLSSPLQAWYQEQFNVLQSNMPIKNHNYEFDQTWTRSWLNVVIETYCGDKNIAMSEKIFRALVTPVPWAVYGSGFTVRYLKSLGFDVLDDLMSHTYDTRFHSPPQIARNKLVDFMNYIDQTTKQLQLQNFNELSARCQTAATHNQNLLLSMRRQWPRDFAQWFLKISEEF